MGVRNSIQLVSGDGPIPIFTACSLHYLQSVLPPVFTAIPLLYHLAECPLERLLESLLGSLVEILLESFFERQLENLLEAASHWEE
jgi:hypothetical protein